MVKADKDMELFTTYILEMYKSKHKLTGLETVKLFASYGVFEYLSQFYRILNGESFEDNVIGVEEFIEARQNEETH